MINAIHAIINATDAEKTREFFRDVLQLPSVDAGHGWLIFALPPAEIAAHPTDDPALSGTCNLYLMCEDIHATVAMLQGKGVAVNGGVADRGWGLVTSIEIPGAGAMGLYQPKHPLAYTL